MQPAAARIASASNRSGSYKCAAEAARPLLASPLLSAPQLSGSPKSAGATQRGSERSSAAPATLPSSSPAQSTSGARPERASERASGWRSSRAGGSSAPPDRPAAAAPCSSCGQSRTPHASAYSERSGSSSPRLATLRSSAALREPDTLLERAPTASGAASQKESCSSKRRVARKRSARSSLTGSSRSTLIHHATCSSACRSTEAPARMSAASAAHDAPSREPHAHAPPTRVPIPRAAARDRSAGVGSASAQTSSRGLSRGYGERRVPRRKSERPPYQSSRRYCNDDAAAAAK
mmetsp:Transcript_21083/g.69733  ORF Transcript_21083/g.69733 Transcript_21083/m.69733 type:complete len:293 (-) Transcript_21083:261-1139(-)